MTTFSSIFKRSFLEGYANVELSTSQILIVMFFSLLVGLYIYLVYRFLTKKTFYSKSFNIALVAMALITAAIILTIQSSIVVSLGMVGALSIVRFRTAIKDPMDLVFLFWSIGAGIICGAGFAMIAVIGSIVLTMGILVFSILPGDRGSMILVVNTVEYIEGKVIDAVDANCQNWKIRARNIGGGQVSMAIEVRTRQPRNLLKTLSSMENVISVSLVEHDGEVTA
jgi:hypothetical protein